MLMKACFRFMDAMEEEERAWVMYDSGWGGLRYTVTDECRLRRWSPRDGDKPLPEILVHHERFKDRGSAQHYIKYECIRAGLIHVVCFWRKEPPWMRPDWPKPFVALRKALSSMSRLVTRSPYGGPSVVASSLLQRNSKNATKK